jgi:histidine triad (HIT) family protein
MPTVFTRIIDGELPGRFVWRDDQCVAFLSINPIRPGHTLVVPRVELDQWTDADPALNGRLLAVAQHIGIAQKAAFPVTRIGLIIAGFEVPHLHVHVIPTNDMGGLDFANAAAHPDPGELDDAAERIRTELRRAGHHPETA